MDVVRLRRHLLTAISRHGLTEGRGGTWHVDLVEAVHSGSIVDLRLGLAQRRSEVVRTAIRETDRDAPPDRAALDELSDADLFVAMGADRNGRLEMADALASGDRARGDDPGYRRRALWTTLMRRFHEHLRAHEGAYALHRLEPTIGGLRKVARRLFPDYAGACLVVDLPGVPSAQKTRIANALERAALGDGGPRISTMPPNAFELMRVDGIGETRVEMLREGVLELLARWPEERTEIGLSAIDASVESTPTLQMGERSPSTEDLERLWQQAAAAHEQLIRDADFSVLSRVCGALDGEIALERGSSAAALRLARAYAFFGTESSIGSRRRGFKSRFKEEASGSTRTLFARIRRSRFGAWRHRETSSDDEGSSGTYSNIGPYSETTGGACRCLGVDGSSAEAAGGACVGWRLPGEDDEMDVLLAAAPLDEEVEARLEETAERDGWRQDGAIDGTEYERDVLTAVLAPEALDPGVSPLAFIPPNQRDAFVPEFRRHLMKHVARKGLLEDGGIWHLDLVRAQEEDSLDEVRAHAQALRERASRFVTIHRAGDIDVSKLDRVISDADLFVALGAGPDGGIEAEALPKRSGRRRRDAGRERMGDRWRVLMRRFLDHLELYDDAYELDRLEPTYNELRRVVDECFPERLGDRPVAELPVDDPGQLSRIVTRLERYGDLAGDEETVRLSDLPSSRHGLFGISGIGEASIDRLRGGLLAGLVERREPA